MPQRFRLATLLVLAPLLAIVVALGSWVLALRAQVAELDRRVMVLEATSPAITMIGNGGVSSIGVPLDVDRAMQMEPFLHRR